MTVYNDLSNEIEGAKKDEQEKKYDGFMTKDDAFANGSEGQNRNKEKNFITFLQKRRFFRL